MEQNKKRHLRNFILVIVFVLILGYLLWLFLPPQYPSGFLQSLYSVHKARMTYCQAANYCEAQAVSTFSPGKDICIAWTDQERTARDHLSITVYNTDTGAQVFNQFDLGRYGSECRQLRISKALTTGNYRTEFHRPVIEGYNITAQGLNTVIWSINP